MKILPEVVTEAFGVALVGYVASLALAHDSAQRFHYSVDDNQVKIRNSLKICLQDTFIWG